MRYATALLLTAAAFGLCSCVTEPNNAQSKVETTPEANRSGVKGVAESPLRDLNVLRTKIPAVLLQSMADPYARPGAGRCTDLLDELGPLDDALGDDLDAPSLKQERMMDKGKTTALTVASGAASDVIPFRGWIRKLSGAEQHDRYVQAAITAGAVRRAYLKGLGEAKGCNPPATPSHELAGTPIMDQAMKPKYPTH